MIFLDDGFDFDKWIVSDENGNAAVRSDAPDDVREVWERYIAAIKASHLP